MESGRAVPGLTLDDLRRPHASIPHNPLIADPMFLAQYAEKAGTGILDMIARCAQAGLPAPEFRQSGSQFVQTVCRSKAAREVASEVTPEVTPEAAPEVAAVKAHDEAHEPITAIERTILARCAEPPRTRAELLDALGYQSRTGNFKKAVARPLTRALLDMTQPERPRARSQRYRTTAKGLSALAQPNRRVGAGE